MHARAPLPWLALLLPAVLAGALYATTVQAPFLFDDLGCVVENEQIKSLSQALDLWGSSFPPQRVIGGLYRPITAFSLMLDHARGGLVPANFHATNVLLHALASAALARLVLRLGRSAREACLAGCLFALHAVHVEAVAWVVGRAEVLAALFTFLSATAWIDALRTRSRLQFLWAGAAWFLALSSKEIAAALPLVLFLATRLSWTEDAAPPAAAISPARTRGQERRAALRASPSTAKETVLPRATLASFAPFALALLVYLGLRTRALNGLTPASASLALAGSARLATALGCLVRDVGLLFVPWPLRIDYDGEVVAGFGDARPWLGLALVLGLALAAWSQRRRRPWVTLWIAWFAAFQLIVSNLLVPIGAVMAERFLYLPSAAVCVLGAALFEALLRARPVLLGRALAGLLLACAVGWGALALARERDWGDAERFWRTALRQRPESEKAHLSLSDELFARARAGEEALELLRAGVALRPGLASRDHVELVLRLARRLRDAGRPEESLPWFDEGVRALERDPNLSALALLDARVFQALALEACGQLEQARAVYERCVASARSAGVEVNLALLLGRLGRKDEELAHLQRALEIDPRLGIAHLNLGLRLIERERTEEGLAALERARSLTDPRLLQGVLAGWARDQAAQRTTPELAAPLLSVVERLARIAGDSPGLALARGQLAEHAGQRERAQREYESALVQDPALAPARDGLERCRSR